MGHIKRQELHDLENGLWPQYVPKVYVESIAKAVANGFKVLPMLNQGVKNEGFYIIQMIEVGTNGILQP